MTTLVLGVGHPDRGDDGAGAIVARALEDTEGVVARIVSGDPSSILTDPLWDTAERVVLVDTVRTGRRPGTVHRWSGQRLLEHLPAAGGGTHDLGVATTLHLAVALARLPDDLTVIGIEGTSFEVGHPPCRPVRHAAAMIAAALAREIGDPEPDDVVQVAIRIVDLEVGVDAEERGDVRLGES